MIPVLSTQPRQEAGPGTAVSPLAASLCEEGSPPSWFGTLGGPGAQPSGSVSCPLSQTWVPSAKITLLQPPRGWDGGPGSQVPSSLPSPCPGLVGPGFPRCPHLLLFCPPALWLSPAVGQGAAHTRDWFLLKGLRSGGIPETVILCDCQLPSLF